MKEQLVQMFGAHPHLAVLLSLALSIVVAVLGLVPSVFITAANILFFGFWQGLFISFLGEALGAIVSFFLYRKGFQKKAGQRLHRFPKVAQLVNAEGSRAFLLVFALRLLPFVPSGLVTFAAAIGKMGWFSFVLASSAGKVPALLLEGYSVYQVTEMGTSGKIILAAIAVILLIYLLRSKKEAGS